MLTVRFKRNWFGPDANLYHIRDNPHELPESMRDALPEDAEVKEPEVEEKLDDDDRDLKTKTKTK